MATAAELIQALQRRLRLTHYRSRPGEFPPGWQAWFDAMRERSGAVTGATPGAIVAVLLQRRPVAVPPQRLLALNRWQAFSTLWRQEWHPAAPEERWLRALAATVSVLVHLVLAVAFVWLGIVQLVALSAPPRGEENVIQVEFLGTGAPEQVGGGPVPEQEPVRESVEAPQPVAAEPRPPVQPPAPPPASPAEPTAATPPSVPRLPPLPDAPDVQVPQLQAEQPQLARREIPEPQPSADQPLVVSKPVPDRGSFVLPPPTLEAPDPGTAVPTLQLPTPQLQAADAPEPLPEIRPALPAVEVTAPAMRTEAPELVVREIPGPLPRMDVPRPAAPTVAVPELDPQVSSIPERAVPMAPAPEPEPAPDVADEERAVADAPESVVPPEAVAVPGTESAPQPPEPQPSEPQASEPQPSEPQPSEPQPIAGAGPEPVPAPGGWPAPQVDDSWDLAEREQPGAQAGEPPGLYDSDGSVNLGDTPGSASPGFPPGTVTEEIADLDRAGTWLRRPPNDFEPSAFAQYWRPNETLIAEWVRKSITTVRIPIPGTSKSIVCTTVLIAVGGTCSIHDPNLNDQPPTARPPPDIPFKPELQEGNGSVPPAD